MFYNDKSELLNEDFIKNPQNFELFTEDFIYNQIIKIDDRIKDFYDDYSDYIKEKRILVGKKNTPKDLTYYFTKDGNLLVLLDHSLTFFREYVVGAIITYPLWLKIYRSNKYNITTGQFAIQIYSKLLFDLNRRPIQEQSFYKNALFWCILHFLSLPEKKLVSKEEIKSFYSKFSTIDYDVEKYINKTFDKISESLKLDYNTKIWFNLMSNELLNSSYDLTLSTLINKYGVFITAGLDEPLYAISDVILSKLFKVNLTSNKLKSEIFGRIITFALSYKD